MRTFFLTAVATVTLAGAVSAGAPADPVVEPLVVAQDATSSSSGMALVALLAVLVAIPALD